MGTLRVAFVSALALELLATLSVALVAVSIGLRLVGGGLDLHTALVVLILAPEVYLPLRAVGARFHDSAEGVAAANEIFELLDEKPPTGPGRSPAPDPSRVPIRLDAVTVDSRSPPPPSRWWRTASCRRTCRHFGMSPSRKRRRSGGGGFAAPWAGTGRGWHWPAWPGREPSAAPSRRLGMADPHRRVAPTDPDADRGDRRRAHLRHRQGRAPLCRTPALPRRRPPRARRHARTGLVHPRATGTRAHRPDPPGVCSTAWCPMWTTSRTCWSGCSCRSSRPAWSGSARWSRSVYCCQRPG